MSWYPHVLYYLSGPKNTFHIHHHFTCSSVCVIYSITCTKCSILYIGETSHQLNTRSGQQLRSVEENKHLSPEYQDDDDINVAIHFNLPNQSDRYGIVSVHSILLLRRTTCLFSSSNHIISSYLCYFQNIFSLPPYLTKG